MKTKKWVLPVCMIAGAGVLCIVALFAAAGIMSAKGYGISVGRFYLSDFTCYLVDEGKAMVMSDQSGDKKLFDGISTGDLVLVIHDGIAESYPSQTGAYRVFRLSKGDESDLPENLDIGAVKIGGTEDVLTAHPVGFDAQYIRTGGYHEDARYPAVRLIRSVRELRAYYEANKEKYSLGRNDNVSSDSTIGFLDACDKYDGAYFEDHVLIMVLLEEGSGSNRHQVRSVHMSDGGRCCIYIDRIVPEVGTCDMAEWHILIEPEAGIEIESESDITVFVDGVDPLTQPELVRFGRGYADISLSIPHGWEYETELWADSSDFSVSFFPSGRPEGKIRVRYYGIGFGVCGTGLEVETIRLGNYEARKGTYDGHKVWDHIRLIGTPGDYAIENEGAGQWWGEYGDEAMRILNTLVVGDGIISEAEAAAIAKAAATVKYDRTWASYDSENGLWTVTFGKEYPGGDQTVTITCEGKVIDIQYGE